MANSTYPILETRCVVEEAYSFIYVKIGDANDFIPIGGWYRAVISAEVPCLPFLENALCTQAYLSWTRKSPPPDGGKHEL
jgi:hypothetical protein